MGIPLSTKMKEGSWYISVDFQGQTVVAHLAQVRVFSASRLYGRMGILEEKSRAKIKSGFIRLYC